MNGAHIANAVLDGRAQAYIEHGANELLKGPLRSLLGANYVVVRAGVRAFTGRELQEVLTEGSTGMLDDLAASPSVADLAVGSNYMRAAVALNVPQHKISINGNEERPVHYRLASTAAFNNDELLVGAVETARGLYNTKYIKNLLIFGPIGVWRAAGWKAGRDYLDEHSETGWNNLIGATRTEETRSCFTSFTCSYDFYYSSCTNGNYTPSCDNCWREVCQDVQRTYNEPSDGLIHESSQTGARTLTINSNWRADNTFEALGANHNEYDSHPGAQNAFSDIFDAAGSVDPFFRIRRR
jgi:hypothetical protein